MRIFFRPASAPSWLSDVLNSIRGALSDEWPTPLKLKSFAVADVPPAADWACSLIYVPDESAGPAVVFSDGTDWLRVDDGTVIS